MTEDLIIQLGQESLKTAALISMPLLGSALIVGLVVSVFQAITQINEATLTFIPKILIIAIVLIVAGPWMMDVMSKYSADLFSNLAEYVRQ